MSIRLLTGDVRAKLAELEPENVQGVATSPPYFQLRAYGTEPQVWGGDPEHAHEWTAERVYSAFGSAGASSDAFTAAGPDNASRLKAARWRDNVWCPCGAWRGELGQEPTPALFVEHTVEWMRAVRRVLRTDGCVLLNIGDSYAGSGKGQNGDGSAGKAGAIQQGSKGTLTGGIGLHDAYHGSRDLTSRPRWPSYAKPKDLLGIPWRVAFALQDDGWYLRGDYIWHKPAPMPESVTDRCTRSHEYIFHLTKSPRYFWNQDELREPLAPKTLTTFGTERKALGNDELGQVKADNWSRDVPIRKSKLNADGQPAGGNKRTVWTIATSGFTEAHFATFPPELAETMVKAISRPGDTVLDPFGGAGTLALVADRLGRNAISVELKPEYAEMQTRRLTAESPLFTELEVA